MPVLQSQVYKIKFVKISLTKHLELNCLHTDKKYLDRVSNASDVSHIIIIQ